MIYPGTNIELHPTSTEDLESLFVFQTDIEAQSMAAFTPLRPGDKKAYIDKYTALLKNPEVHQQTIWQNGKIVGSISKFCIDNEAEITYWIDKAYWGKGIASEALKQFLQLEMSRPLMARVAFDNYPSQIVLERNGFIRKGKDKGFANARQCEIEEFIYILQ